MNKRPTMQQIRNLRSRLADAQGERYQLYKALETLMDALHPGMGAGFPDSVLPAYDEARSVLQRVSA